MSSRIRPPAWETEYEQDHYDDEPARQRGRRTPPPRHVRKVGLPALGLAVAGALLVGFLANSGGGGTVTQTVTATRTVKAPAAAAAGAAVGASGAASRSAITLAVLNGSGRAGLAASTASQARALGYTSVTESNSPQPATSDRVLYRHGAQAKARQVATDLNLPAPLPAAQDAAVTAPQARAAEVIVVLGSSGH